MLEAGNQAIHRRISELQEELREPITNRMSECSGVKFAEVQRFFGLIIKEVQWNFTLTPRTFCFEWDGRPEVQRMPDIVESFSNSISEFQFRDARAVSVVVDYAVGEMPARFKGELDIAVLLPDEVATMPETIFCQSICIIEVKTPTRLLNGRQKCINQTRLQLLAINSGGNPHKPFALLTNMTDYWHFMWVTENNLIYSVSYDNSQAGLEALKEGLDMMNGVINNCPFTVRNLVNFSAIRGGGYIGDNETIANMEEFYDEMTPRWFVNTNKKFFLINSFR